MEFLIYCEWVGQVKGKNKPEEFYLQNFYITWKGVNIKYELRKRCIWKKLFTRTEKQWQETSMTGQSSGNLVTIPTTK